MSAEVDRPAELEARREGYRAALENVAQEVERRRIKHSAARKDCAERESFADAERHSNKGAALESLGHWLRREVDALRAEAGEDSARLLNVARGCLDYGGGYRDEPHALEIYHHGIQTVINALEVAAKNDPNDTQVNALERIGKSWSAK